ncbi:MAG TPA: helix-turn-helix domain-containing protein [Steroidobacteraceae bacterium]|nr:helix-turn-helix domain-containing protein [Steroidobacteraceae bacterium]
MSIEPRAKFAYWREAICETILNVAPEAVDTATFNAELTCRRVGGIKVTSFSSSGHRIIRTARHVSQSDDDSFLISYQAAGRSLLSQGDGAVVLDPGEVGIINGSQPFQADFLDDVTRAIAVVPAGMMYRRAPWLRRCAVGKIGNGSPYVALARAVFDSLSHEAYDEGGLSTSLLVESLCNVVAISTSGDGQDVHGQSKIAELLAECCRQLSDPDLCPEKVALGCRISVRTVHHRFAAMGTTFGRWVLEHRLERCFRDLQNPMYSESGIAEIAFRWGFNDLSHFNKTFRRQYGVTPGSARRVTLSY